MKLLVRWLINAIGLWMATMIIPGVAASGWQPLLAAALLLGLVNALVRPVLVLLTLPITLVTLGLFLALVWRALYIARLAADAGLKFQSYVAAGFGIWLGLQAFINIGVNMGALPTKGLTLPLMSYGRSSMIVTLAWVGLLLRVYHEAMQSARGSAVPGRRTVVQRGGDPAEVGA